VLHPTLHQLEEQHYGTNHNFDAKNIQVMLPSSEQEDSQTCNCTCDTARPPQRYKAELHTTHTTQSFNKHCNPTTLAFPKDWFLVSCCA
jgi:hypothetical protein